MKILTQKQPGIEWVQAPADILHLALCCHGNETRAPLANLPSNVQLEGTPCDSPKLHPGPCSSVRMWRGKGKERKGKERKGKEEYLYSAFPHQSTYKALRHGSHSFTCKQHHASLSFVAFTRCRHHSNWGSRHPIAAHYSLVKLAWCCREGHTDTHRWPWPVYISSWLRLRQNVITVTLCFRLCWRVYQASLWTMIAAASCSTWQRVACRKPFKSYYSEQVRNGWRQPTLECKFQPRCVDELSMLFFMLFCGVFISYWIKTFALMKSQLLTVGMHAYRSVPCIW